LVGKVTREFIGTLVTSMTIFGLRRLQYYREKCSRQIGHVAMSASPLSVPLLPLRSITASADADVWAGMPPPAPLPTGLPPRVPGLRVDKSARSRWRWNLVSLLLTVPEDKETTRHGAYGVGLVMLRAAELQNVEWRDQRVACPLGQHSQADLRESTGK
jgi:hypothetical protein